LKISLGDESSLEIVGEAENEQVAIAQIEILKSDVILMDIQISILDRVEATKQIGHLYLETKVLSLMVDDTEEYLSQSLKYGTSEVEKE